MNKKSKFILFVQTILAARTIKEKLALTIINDAIEVTEKELISDHYTCLCMDATDFVDWRTRKLKFDDWFAGAPKWLTKETVSKILVG